MKSLFVQLDFIFKPQGEWNALDRWVNWRLNAVSSDSDIASYLKLAATEKDRLEHDPANVADRHACRQD